MLSIFDAAKYILENTGTISPGRLQKLCYYAQAWSLVWDADPIFPEVFEAWVCGPVCPELHDIIGSVYPVHTKDISGNPNLLTTEQKESINSVLDYYGSRSAQWLTDLVHMETPWKIARGNLPKNAVSHNPISKQDMIRYYSGL